MQYQDYLKKLNNLIGETEAVYHQSAVKFGVSDSVNKILYALYMYNNQCSLAEICLQTGLSKQTVNSALRTLERSGMVASQAINGKAKLIVLTDKGKQFNEQNTARLVDMEVNILSQWTKEEIDKYLLLTERYLHNLRELVNKL